MSGRVGRRVRKQRVNKRWLAYSAGIMCGLLALVILLQLLYPPGRLLPFVRINGEIYGGQTTERVVAGLEAVYKDARFDVRAGGKTHVQSFVQAGLSVRSTPTATEAGKYSLKQRLIPFSSVLIMLRRNAPLEVRIDKERVHYFAEQVEKESSVPAINAAIKVEGDIVRLVPARPSKDFPAEAMYRELLAAPLSAKVVIVPKAVSKQPAISDEAVREVLKMARHIVDTPLVLHVGDTDVHVDKATVASWFDFPVKDGKMELAIKSDSIKKYVTDIQPQGYRAPTSTRITIVDGHETGRLIGAAGRGLDVDAATQQVEQHLKAAKAETLTLPTVALTPGTSYDRQYTGSSAGLFAYLSDLVAGKGNYAITVTELGGPARTASVNGDKVYVAASTYKLFIAYAVFKVTASGEMKWDEEIGGLRADACFEAMVVHSDNDCAWAFGERIGWHRIQDMMHAEGLASTTLNSDGDGKYTTANDLTLYLKKLEEGTLLPTASRDLLIGYLKRQVYRNGIPAATGLPVANKVGGYGNYVHDAGIVYAPGHTYIMVIMSYGSSWPALTTTARQVHSFVMR